MTGNLSSGFDAWLPALLVAFLSGFTYFLMKGYQARSLVNKLRKQGMVSIRNLTSSFIRHTESGQPMPEFSWIMGHLLAAKPVMDALPSDAHTNVVTTELSRGFTTTDAFYMDFWPFSRTILAVSSPSAAMQVTQQYNLPKPALLHDYFLPLTGGANLFTMTEAQWKPWRATFNPGFSASCILEKVPHIVEEVAVYCEILREHARKADVFSLDETTLSLTMDIIGTVTLDTRLNSQRVKNPLASALRSQVNWLSFGNEFNPWQRWHPIRPILQWYNGRVMNKFIEKELDKRFAERQRDHNSSEKDLKPSKSVVSLALESYMAEHMQGKSTNQMDKMFKAYATAQIRLFLFAGHDTTSSTLCYCYHLLSTHPEAMARLRAEHDKLFGTDLSRVPSVLVENPHLLNQIPYTLAVIKEAMRLFPAASSMREGSPGVDIIDDAGNRYPTEGVYVWVLHLALQRNPKYWKEPDSFIPERWLVEPDDPLYPVKGAWRPFEFGPRNCIGQTLVTMDIRTVLVMTVREFDIRAAYDDWDKLHPKKAIKTVRGERAYQIEKGGAHPADGFPCRVTFRK
ncbi:MAG: hypothetical protein M1830_006660 [Pleopsidium flavum]|nr:MAG: hypothetical protein M1830_006660 [Pleopsidium flavum]